MENESKLTGIIGGTSKKGRQIAAEKLSVEGSDIAIFDRKLDDTVAELAKISRVGNKVNGIVFFELAEGTDKELLETNIQKSENHFGRNMDELIRVINLPDREPLVLYESFERSLPQDITADFQEASG